MDLTQTFWPNFLAHPVYSQSMVVYKKQTIKQLDR